MNLPRCFNALASYVSCKIVRKTQKARVMMEEKQFVIVVFRDNRRCWALNCIANANCATQTNMLFELAVIDKTAGSAVVTVAKLQVQAMQIFIVSSFEDFITADFVASIKRIRPGGCARNESTKAV